MPGFEDRGRSPPVTDHQQELVKLFHSFSARHSHWKVFTDFCEVAALAFSNAVDLAQRAGREERYLQIVKGYNRAELDAFAEGLAHLTLAMEAKTGDVLGRTYHDLELHNKWAGQYFTPYDLCRMLAKMTVGSAEDLMARIAERGFVTAQEPAVGSGAMVIALAEELRAAGINYQHHLHVTAVDIDAKCVHMAYVQFTLLHIPAVIVHGDTLSLKEYAHWYTPAHLFDGWRWRLDREAKDGETDDVHPPPAAPLPPPILADPSRPNDPPKQLTLF
jgi:hypothetical protein